MHSSSRGFSSAPQILAPQPKASPQLVDDLVDDQLRALLAERWDRELHYFATLLTDLPGARDPATCASVLLDALNGAMWRYEQKQRPGGPHPRHPFGEMGMTTNRKWEHPELSADGRQPR